MSKRDTSPLQDPEARKKPGRRMYPAHGCPTGKRGWKSRAEAKRVLKAARKRPLQPEDAAEGKARPRSVYKCPHCPHWHLTSQEQREPRALTEHERIRRFGVLKSPGEAADGGNHDHQPEQPESGTVPRLSRPATGALPPTPARRANGAQSRRNRRHGRPRGR